MKKNLDSKTTNKPLLAPYPSWIHIYWQKICAGEIIVCRRIKQNIARLLADFENPEIYIDLAESQKRIQFIQNECKLYEAPFAGKPFRLELFQKAIIESIYAIKVWSDEAGRYIRKYHDVLLMFGRKNGKTPLSSAISLSEFVCGEMGTKVLFGSNDYDQADLAFQAADAMREESPKIARCTRRNNKGIYFGNPKHKRSKGKFSYQNKGSIRKISAHGKNKEGRNIKVGVVDEVHEMQDNSLVAPIRQALSTQEEPLYFEITTEGFTDDGYLDQRLAEAEKVLDGEIDRPDWVIWWYCQDSEEEVWQDESSWIKSNPGLGVIKKVSYLRKQVDEARINSSTRAFVLSKDFNIKQNSAVAWLDVGDIENTATFDLSMLAGKLSMGGVDLAETTDLCSARQLIETTDPVNGYRRFTFGMYFIPEAKADAILEDNNLNPERKNYREWERKGLVTICPGNEVDDEMVVNWYVQIYQAFGIIPYKVGFDNWHSRAFKNKFSESFGEDVLERVGMDFMSLSGPMRALEADLKHKALNFNNNEMDRWCLKNTAVKTNNIGLIMPVKKYGTSKNRIDGALSGIISYAVLGRFRSEYRSLQMMR
ncbi:MAG: terminase large subunit [Lachnospiraceae bacterium]|nr:terminase large subunit [Lachnospiraceae bacterium]